MAEVHGNRTHLPPCSDGTPDLKSGRATSALSTSVGRHLPANRKKVNRFNNPNITYFAWLCKRLKFLRQIFDDPPKRISQFFCFFTLTPPSPIKGAGDILGGFFLASFALGVNGLA